ncbi:MAG TPA: HD domain-containing protein [Vicinamibacterales bacterium]|jgi:tRNA nucleotidyltransferase (CCA-adding enzyme)
MTSIERARLLADAIRTAGGRALIVGGWVRDRLLGLTSKDIDVEVYGLPAADLRRLLERFGHVETIGESFTVYKIGDIDVALPRRESKAGRGHKGFLVEGDPGMAVEEAARRRDFTINAIAWDPLTEIYLDPRGGRDDLERRILRVVDPSTFGDDSLRVLRAMQFVARFELDVDPATLQLCRVIPLDDLPAERVWGEFEKLLLLPARPSRGFSFARDAGIVDRLLPEMAALVGCEQEPEWHPEGDVWTHTLLVIDQAHRRTDDLPRASRLAVMLGAVCHDFGKPSTTAFFDGRTRSHNHEEAGVPPARALLDRLNVHSIDGVDVRSQVFGLTAHHLKPGSWYKVRDEVGDGAFRRLAQKVDLELLARLAAADCLGRTGEFDCTAMAWFLDRARSLGVEHEPPRPLLLGRHLLALGLEPGPRIGEILRVVYERQLDGTITTTDEGILAAKAIVDDRSD